MKNTKTFLKLAVIGLMSLILASASAYAQNVTPVDWFLQTENCPAAPPNGVATNACDPCFMDKIKARANLEAQREITQNQNLIFKADSVLEYSCFNQHLGLTAGPVAARFSEAGVWGPVLSGSSMGTALQESVLSAIENYALENFEHTYLGGRVGANYNMNGFGAPYNCPQLNAVWQLARCYNFASQAGSDGFFSFPNYATTADKRAFPGGSCAAPYPRWGAEIATASGTPVQVVTYLETLILPAADNDDCTNSIAIPTGITIDGVGPVNQAGTSSWNDTVCAKPGCYFCPGPPSGGGTFAAGGTCTSIENDC